MDRLEAFESRLEELVVAEAGVALATIRIEDPERRAAPRGPGAIAGDQDLRPLADDVSTEAEPRSTGQLEPDPCRLADGRRDA